MKCALSIVVELKRLCGRRYAEERRLAARPGAMTPVMGIAVDTQKEAQIHLLSAAQSEDIVPGERSLPRPAGPTAPSYGPQRLYGRCLYGGTGRQLACRHRPNGVRAGGLVADITT